ncbi:MAG TPA: GNAT family N-acetyltransferase [Rhizomicrobium sp.]|jgi:ribosomal protein S18 acetylase RimI-like enzyme
MESAGRPRAVTFAVESPSSADAQWCLAQYIQDLDVRFPYGFDPAQSNPAADEDMMLPKGLLLLARCDAEPVGCGALKLHDGWAELKRLWIAASARGLGLGRQMVFELERLAVRNRASLIRLETNKSLTEAITLYRASGYREVTPFNAEPYADHWFEKPLLPDLYR